MERGRVWRHQYCNDVFKRELRLKEEIWRGMWRQLFIFQMPRTLGSITAVTSQKMPRETIAFWQRGLNPTCGAVLSSAGGYSTLVLTLPRAAERNHRESQKKAGGTPPTSCMK